MPVVSTLITGRKATPHPTTELIAPIVFATRDQWLASSANTPPANEIPIPINRVSTAMAPDLLYAFP